MSDSKTMPAGGSIRPLTADDLETVVAIDAKITGRPRRGFYEKRLQAAQEEPKGFIYVGACKDGGLVGFVMARLLAGEFGSQAPVAVLDAIGVDPAAHGGGWGSALMDGLDDVMRQKGVSELQSQVDWTNHGLIGFMDQAGFELAPRYVLRRQVGGPIAF